MFSNIALIAKAIKFSMVLRFYCDLVIVSISDPPVFAGGSQVRLNEVSKMCVTVISRGTLGDAERENHTYK